MTEYLPKYEPSHHSSKDVGIEKEQATASLSSLLNINMTVYWMIVKPKIIKNNGELTLYMRPSPATPF